MVIFECLIVRPYKGTSIADQKRIVQRLDGLQNNLIWAVRAETLDEVHQVESALQGRVPYLKVVV